MSSKGQKLIAKVDKCSRRKKDRLLNNVCMIDVKRDEYVVEKDSIIQCLQEDVNDLRLIFLYIEFKFAVLTVGQSWK